MDSDTTTRVGDHARLLERFGDDGDVLVGTQMVAKGLDFPQVTLVGAIAADLDLHVADYRAGNGPSRFSRKCAGGAGARAPAKRSSRPTRPTTPRSSSRPATTTRGSLAKSSPSAAPWAGRRSRGIVLLGAIGRSRPAVEACDRAVGRRPPRRQPIRSPGPRPVPGRAGQRRMALSRGRADASSWTRYGLRFANGSWSRRPPSKASGSPCPSTASEV